MTLRTLAPIATLLAVAACGGNAAPYEATAPVPSTASSVEAPLRINGSLQVGSSRPLTVTFQDVEQDSRCPADVQCAWAGDAAIVLRLSRDGRSAGTTLHTTLEPTEVEYEGYEVRLVSVEPTPRADRETPKSEYRVTVRVTQRR